MRIIGYLLLIGFIIHFNGYFSLCFGWNNNSIIINTIYGNDCVELLLVDPNNRKTGYIQTKNDVLNSIPKSYYKRTPHKYLQVTEPRNGTYILEIIGQKVGIYKVNITLIEFDSRKVTRDIQGVIAKNDINRILFDFTKNEKLNFSLKGYTFKIDTDSATVITESLINNKEINLGLLKNEIDRLVKNKFIKDDKLNSYIRKQLEEVESAIKDNNRDKTKKLLKQFVNKLKNNQKKYDYKPGSNKLSNGSDSKMCNAIGILIEDITTFEKSQIIK